MGSFIGGVCTMSNMKCVNDLPYPETISRHPHHSPDIFYLNALLKRKFRLIHPRYKALPQNYHCYITNEQ